MTTRISILGAVLTILALIVSTYELKYTVKAKAAEIQSLERDIALEEKTIEILETEWTYLTDPTRLESLAARHLDLMPLKPEQWVVVDAKDGIGDALAMMQHPEEEQTQADRLRVKASHKKTQKTLNRTQLTHLLRRVEANSRKFSAKTFAQDALPEIEGTQIVSR